MICIVTSPPVGELTVAMSRSVCLFARECVSVSVREHISGITRQIFTKFSCLLPSTAVVRSSSGSVVTWPTLCTSGFMDDVIFTRDGPHEDMWIPLQRVTSLRRRQQDDALLSRFRCVVF